MAAQLNIAKEVAALVRANNQLTRQKTKLEAQVARLQGKKAGPARAAKAGPKGKKVVAKKVKAVEDDEAPAPKAKKVVAKKGAKAGKVAKKAAPAPAKKGAKVVAKKGAKAAPAKKAKGDSGFMI